MTKTIADRKELLRLAQPMQKCHKGIWHTIIHDPEGDTLAKCARLYCQVWAEPPWDEYEWDLEAVELELGEASADPDTIFVISLVRGEVNGFTIGYPLSEAALAVKAGGDQLRALHQGYDQLFYVAELGVGRENRGHGTGKLLSTILLAQAEALGFTRFILRTNIEAHPARALYGQLGFTDTGIQDANHPTRTYWVRDA